MHGYADQVGLSHIKPHDFRPFVGTQRAKQHRIGPGVPIGSPRFTVDYAQRIVDRDHDPPVVPAQLDLFDGV